MLFYLSILNKNINININALISPLTHVGYICRVNPPEATDYLRGFFTGLLLGLLTGLFLEFFFFLGFALDFGFLLGFLLGTGTLVTVE